MDKKGRERIGEETKERATDQNDVTSLNYFLLFSSGSFSLLKEDDDVRPSLSFALSMFNLFSHFLLRGERSFYGRTRTRT